ncbi:MAG TPA: hypothetical protein VH500_04610 [Nitrososphaeraceae archaeon]
MSNEENLDSAQKDQKNIGKAGSNPQTAGPSENLREEAAEKTNEGDQSEEPA